MDPLGFMADMTLLGLLEFQKNAWSLSPDDLVDQMLKQAYEYKPQD